MSWYLDFQIAILLMRKGMAVGLMTQRTTQSWKTHRRYQRIKDTGASSNSYLAI